MFPAMMPHMTGARASHRSDWGRWRDVVAAWILSVVLTCALFLTVPKDDRHGRPTDFRPVASGAMHAHRQASDVEGPRDGEECLERDYVMERC